MILVFWRLLTESSTRPQKGGFMRDAASESIALVFPDTSPRGAGIEGEDNHWDFGTGKIRTYNTFCNNIRVSCCLMYVGAGFYLNATNAKYSRHYNMFTHVTMELPKIIEAAGLPIVRACCSSLPMLITLPGLQAPVNLLPLDGRTWCSDTLPHITLQH